MKITVGVASATLKAMLDTEDATYRASIEDSRIVNGLSGSFGVNIQNLSGGDVYIETVGIAATTTDSRKIADGEDFNFVCQKLTNVSLIGSGAGLVCRVTIV